MTGHERPPLDLRSGRGAGIDRRRRPDVGRGPLVPPGPWTGPGWRWAVAALLVCGVVGCSDPAGPGIVADAADGAGPSDGGCGSDCPDATDLCADVSCPPSIDPCIERVCDPASGTCEGRGRAGSRCDLDGDPCTLDVCRLDGTCEPFGPDPACADAADAGGDTAPDASPSGCLAPTATLACDDVAPPFDAVTGAIGAYACPDAPDLGAMPGTEAVYAFTAPRDGRVRFDVEATPEGFAHAFLLGGRCAADACVDVLTLEAGRGTLEAIVTAGDDYFLVIDSAVGGVVSVGSVWVRCSAGEACDNLVDDDFDGLVDCADSDCAGAGPPCEDEEATCDDGLDNDADGATDCADAACDGVGSCEAHEASCDDDVDNDGDGATDCDDLSCVDEAACLVACEDKAMPLACGEERFGVGETRRTFRDYPCVAGSWPLPEVAFRFEPETSGQARLALSTSQDQAVVVVRAGPECASGPCVATGTPTGQHFGEVATFPFEAGETYWLLVDATAAGAGVDATMSLDRVRLTCSAAETCDDGVDNDFDGAVDCADVECLQAGAPCELAEATCDDGFDNDGDGATDCADPACVLVDDRCESPEATCDDGADNDGDGGADCADPDCLSRAGCEATEATCDDAFDNDADGVTDCDDPDCGLTAGCAASCGGEIEVITCGWEAPAPTSSSVSHLPVSPCTDQDTPGADLAFEYTATADRNLRFEASAGGVDELVVTMHEATCATDSCVAWRGPLDEPGTIRTSVRAGVTYYFVVDRPTPGPLTLDTARLICAIP